MTPCFECGSPALHQHHVVPVARGGTSTVALCEVCHGKAHGANMSISTLVKEGLARARARGVRLGGERKYDYEAIRGRYNEGLTKREIALEMGIPFETVRKILRKQK